MCAVHTLLSMYGARGDVAPPVALTVRSRENLPGRERPQIEGR